MRINFRYFENAGSQSLPMQHFCNAQKTKRVTID